MPKMNTVFVTPLAALTLTFMISTAQAADKKFDGFYLGAEAGYRDFSGSGNFDQDDFVYDGVIGYRKQMNNGWVLGLEGGSGIDASLGYAMGQNKDFLAFGFVGYSNAKVTTTSGPTQTSTNFDGIRFGVGGEYAVSKHISLRLTGTYTNFEGNFSATKATAGILFRF